MKVSKMLVNALVFLIVVWLFPWPSPVVLTARGQECLLPVAGEFATQWDVARLGCPAASWQNVSFALEPFERGLMFWREDVRYIYVLFHDGTWWSFADTWQEGMPSSDPTIVPPAGFYQPVRGFGLVWRQGQGVRDKIGWATAEEKGYTSLVQTFEKGTMFTADDGAVYTVYNDGTWPAPVVATTWLPTCPFSVPPQLEPAWQGLQDSLGCPIEESKAPKMAVEPFERGLMFWRQDVWHIHVLFHDGTWWDSPDTWQEGMAPSDPTIIPPAGLYQPVRGFGLVWRQGQGVRDKIGWATAQEKGYDAILQTFEKGTVFTDDLGQPYVLYADGTWPTLQIASTATPTPGPEASRIKVWDTAGYQRAMQELEGFMGESAHFSPDGRQFVVGTGLALYLVATDGSTLSWLAAAPAGYRIGSDVLWSPDGRYLAFFVFDQASGSVTSYNVGWVSSAGGTVQLLVANPGQSADWPRWTQDGRLLFTIYQGLEDHTGQVWLFNPDDGALLWPTEPLLVSAGIVGQQRYPWKPGKYWTPEEGGTYVEDY